MKRNLAKVVKLLSPGQQVTALIAKFDPAIALLLLVSSSAKRKRMSFSV